VQRPIQRPQCPRRMFGDEPDLHRLSPKTLAPQYIKLSDRPYRPSFANFAVGWCWVETRLSKQWLTRLSRCHHCPGNDTLSIRDFCDSAPMHSACAGGLGASCNRLCRSFPRQAAVSPLDRTSDNSCLGAARGARRNAWPVRLRSLGAITRARGIIFSRSNWLGVKYYTTPQAGSLTE